MTISEYLKVVNETQDVDIRDSSWETLPSDLKDKNVYPMWSDPKNEVHKLLWNFTKYVLDIVNNNKDDINFYWARKHLDVGLSSCTFWWSSARRPAQTGPITWNPDLVSKGVTELVKAIRSLHGIKKNQKIEAEKRYFNLQKVVWEKHWQNVF